MKITLLLIMERQVVQYTVIWNIKEYQMRFVKKWQSSFLIKDVSLLFYYPSKKEITQNKIKKVLIILSLPPPQKKKIERKKSMGLTVFSFMALKIADKEGDWHLEAPQTSKRSQITRGAFQFSV